MNDKSCKGTGHNERLNLALESVIDQAPFVGVGKGERILYKAVDDWNQKARCLRLGAKAYFSKNAEGMALTNSFAKECNSSMELPFQNM